MKVLVIGDSYGLPRYAKNSFNVELDYAGTYPEHRPDLYSADAADRRFCPAARPASAG